MSFQTPMTVLLLWNNLSHCLLWLNRKKKINLLLHSTLEKISNSGLEQHEGQTFCCWELKLFKKKFCLNKADMK